jgi:hypothetical protein
MSGKSNCGLERFCGQNTVVPDFIHLLLKSSKCFIQVTGGRFFECSRHRRVTTLTFALLSRCTKLGDWRSLVLEGVSLSTIRFRTTSRKTRLSPKIGLC